MTGPELPVTIRPERPGDEAAIHALTAAAFKDMPFSNGDEQHLVDALRRDGDLTLSLIAEDGERIVGHITFSPVTVSDGTNDWSGLGPVSVSPELHGKGIGGALVRRGIADLRERGCGGIVVLGDPAYYSRFGFERMEALSYPGGPAEYFHCLLLDGEQPRGEVSYAPAFHAA